jgi:hypothetical protein
METRKIISTLTFVLLVCISITSLGIAYHGGVRGIGLLGVWFFLTFGIVVVLGQLIPAGILLSSILGASFSSLRKGYVPIRTT